MKSTLTLLCATALLLATTPGASLAAISAAPQASAPVSGILVEDQFFRDHPDLNDEREVVQAACRLLAGTERGSTAAPEVSAALAAMSRQIIARRSPEEWQRKAIRLYPPLGVAGSEFNALFLRHYNELKESSPSFADEPSWPVLLAKRCGDELRGKQVKPVENVQSIPPPPAIEATPPPPPVTASTPKPAGHPLQTGFAIILLALATSAPGYYAYRKAETRFAMEAGRAESGHDSRLWGEALKHAAILYVLVAFFAATRTLFTNADLGFLDRFAVSAAVGTLFGIFVTLPLCILDALCQSIRREAGSRLAHR